MTRFWWVNHNSTFKQEIDGEYLWSPQREKKSRSRAYDNMLRIRPGDAVISYARQSNAHVGRAIDVARAAPQPAEFGKKGEGWSKTGWFVSVNWTPLPQPARHREFWDEVVPLLPEYSPLVLKTRKGNQKVYLAEIPRELFDLICAKAVFDPVAFLREALPASDRVDLIAELEAAAVAEINADLTLSDTVRRQLTAARRGQGAFRAAVQQLRRSCRVTGLEYDPLLVASHIKPWRACSSAKERLDGHNGLMLALHLDRLFDRGLISFQDDGLVLVSPHLSDEHLAALGCGTLRNLNVGAFLPEQRRYLEHHRNHEFLADPDALERQPRRTRKPRASDAEAPSVAVEFDDGSQKGASSESLAPA